MRASRSGVGQRGGGRLIMDAQHIPAARTQSLVDQPLTWRGKDEEAPRAGK